MTITEFLLARIDEDEAAARTAEGPKWIAGYERDGEPGKWRGIKAWLVCLPTENPPDAIAVGDTLLGGTQSATSHAVRHDPARVLAECAAKRQIVELHASRVGYAERLDTLGVHMVVVCSTCRRAERSVHIEGFAGTHFLAPCPTLRALAAVYADHPDYDEAWRP